MSAILGPNGQPVINFQEVLGRLHQQDEMLLQILQQSRFDLLQTQLKVSFLIKILEEASLLPENLDTRWKEFAEAELQKIRASEEKQDQEKLDL